MGAESKKDITEKRQHNTRITVNNTTIHLQEISANLIENGASDPDTRAYTEAVFLRNRLQEIINRINPAIQKALQELEERQQEEISKDQVKYLMRLLSRLQENPVMEIGPEEKRILERRFNIEEDSIEYGREEHPFASIQGINCKRYIFYVTREDQSQNDKIYLTVYFDGLGEIAKFILKTHLEFGSDPIAFSDVDRTAPPTEDEKRFLERHNLFWELKFLPDLITSANDDPNLTQMIFQTFGPSKTVYEDDFKQHLKQNRIPDTDKIAIKLYHKIYHIIFFRGAGQFELINLSEFPSDRRVHQINEKEPTEANPYLPSSPTIDITVEEPESFPEPVKKADEPAPAKPTSFLKRIFRRS